MRKGLLGLGDEALGLREGERLAPHYTAQGGGQGEEKVGVLGQIPWIPLPSTQFLYPVSPWGHKAGWRR